MPTKRKNFNQKTPSGKVKLESSKILHVHKVENLDRELHELEKFNWRTYEIKCPRSGKFWVWNSTVFHVQEVEMFS